MEEADKSCDALAQRGCAEDSPLPAAIDEAMTLAMITNSITKSAIVDYRVLRAAVKKTVTQKLVSLPAFEKQFSPMWQYCDKTPKKIESEHETENRQQFEPRR